MKETNPESKKCFRCNNYEGYYTKGFNRFISTRQGYCRECKKIVNNRDTCDCWKLNTKRWWGRKMSATKALTEILMDISAIRQIFEENEEEK